MKAKGIKAPGNNMVYKCDNCGNHFFQDKSFVVYTKYQFCGDCNRYLFDDIVQFRLDEIALGKL